VSDRPDPQRYVLVSFHAHPDDEALYTGGTLATAAADGHRVILVVATSGESGLAAPDLPGDAPLGERRMSELTASARLLGCRRVVVLGYGDSGLDGRASPAGNPFAHADLEDAAERLAAVLIEEGADVLTTYDPAGGYGHPDHVQVHRVGARAAELAGTPVVVQATVDRDRLRWVMRILHLARRLLPGLHLPPLEASYTAGRDITHRIDVSEALDAKREAMAAHVSQATAPSGVRTLALILRLPRPVFRRVFCHEWFVEPGRPPVRPPCADIFATLRERETPDRG
jgi:LmbE family N-acetylglucosaminyl deacetylase